MASMSPERWSRISALFDAAVDLDEPERSAYLEQHCTDPADLAEVRSLLKHADSATLTNPLAAVQAVVGQAMGRFTPEGWLNRQLGPWRLVRIIGQGGMGVVFAAEHVELGKAAAVKLISRAFIDPLAEARFLRERKILSRLEHPNIARILDGGTEEGMPYFVMELIDGYPLLEWCNSRQLSIDDRLRLFLELCAAVHYAHRNLVVHRDLKPNNVMVTREGVPRLLDFGIARMLESDADDAVTGTADRMMTPGYASPEQILGQPISTATDVYALGAVLFELLTGEVAQPVSSLADAVRIICERPTVPPSSVVQDPARARILKGDLDTIVAMAMRKEPERRYPTAGELGEDIRRYLARLPVTAQPDTALYRLRRFLARNRVAALLGTVALIFLVAGVIGTWQMAEARAVEADRARQRLQEVRQLANRFLFEFDAAIAPIAGTTAAREMIVRTAQEYLAGLVADAEVEPGLADELATAYEKLGTLQGLPSASSLGQVNEGIESFKKAQDLRLKALEQRPDDRVALRALVRNHAVLSSLRSEGENYEDAAAEAEAAVSRAAGLESSTDADDLHAAGEAHHALAERRRQKSGMDLAVKAYERAIQLHRAGLQARPSSSGERLLASSLERMATALSWQGQFEASARALEESSSLRGAALAKNPTDAQAKRRQLVTFQLLSRLYYDPELPSLGDRAAGQVNAERMLELAEELVAKDPANATAMGDLARAYYARAGYWRENDPAKALADYDRALDLTTRMGSGSDALYGRIYLLRLSVIPLRRLGRLNEATERLERAHTLQAELTQKQGQPETFLTAQLLGEKARLAVAKRDPKARQYFEDAIAHQLNMVSKSPTRQDFLAVLSHSLEDAGRFMESQGDTRSACQMHRQRIEAWNRWNQSNTRSPYSLEAQRRAEFAGAACSGFQSPPQK